MRSDTVGAVRSVTVPSKDWTAVAAAAQATLDDLQVVAKDLGAAIRERIPDYEAVSDEELTTAIVRNVSDMLLALRDRRLLSPRELEDFTTTVEERARNGVAIDDYLLAVSIAEGALWEAVVRRAESLTAEQRAEATALRLACMNLVTRTTASAHRRIELASARLDQEHRAQAVRALLRGGLSPDQAQESLARLGLARDDDHLVIHARARDRVDVLKALGARDNALVLWGDDVVGLARSRPVPVKGITVGVAGPVPLADLPRAHRQASVAFDTAWALGLEGVSDLPSLGLRAAVQASPEVGVELRRRYLEPLLASGSLGEELLATARAYLETGSRRDLAATRLHVHQNTVGYRLNRFCELTGVDLSDLTTLAELHWLFTDLDLRR